MRNFDLRVQPQAQPILADEAITSWHGLVRAEAGEDMAALTLDERGMICDCDPAAEALFKCRRSELVWRHVSLLLPQLAEFELMPNGQANPRLRFLCHIGQRFQAVAQDGEHFASELFLNLLDNIERGRLSLIVRRTTLEE